MSSVLRTVKKKVLLKVLKVFTCTCILELELVRLQGSMSDSVVEENGIE